MRGKCAFLVADMLSRSDAPLYRNSPIFSRAAKILRRKIQPRNTLNTRKTDSTLLFLPRISRIPRLLLPLWLRSAALCSPSAFRFLLSILSIYLDHKSPDSSHFLGSGLSQPRLL